MNHEGAARGQEGGDGAHFLYPLTGQRNGIASVSHGRTNYTWVLSWPFAGT